MLLLSRELTSHIPPNGKRKISTQKCLFGGDMLVSWRVFVGQSVKFSPGKNLQT